VGEHTIHAMMGIAPLRHLRLAMLFHDIGKPATKTTDEQGQDHFYGHQEVGAGMTGEIMRRLKFDNDTIHKVKRLVRFHDERPEIKRKTIRKAMVRMGAECFPDIFDVKTADTLAQSQYHRQEKLADIEAFRQMYLDILAEGECVEKKDLAIDGRDLLAMGVPQGKALGELLQELFELVVEHPEKNTKEYLLTEAEKRIK
jgi:tRNA nucleotidyltransferase (CCA-adding enzyme)